MSPQSGLTVYDPMKKEKTFANAAFQPMSNDPKKSSDPNGPRKKERKKNCLFVGFFPFVGN